MRKVRENIIAAFGDQAVFAAAQNVYNSDGSLNPLPGQIVFYNPISLKSVGSVTVATNDRIVVGVALDTNGDGRADSIRKVFGDRLFGNYVSTSTAEPPRTGTPHIVDLLFTDSAAGEYSINITVEDDETQNQYPYKRPAGYTYTVKQLAGGTSTDLACLFEQAINNNVGTSSAAKQSVFNKLAKKAPVLPFSAVRLFAYTYDYCLNPVAGACDTCLEIPAIGAVFADTAETVLTNSVNPASDQFTYIAQLEWIVSQINTILDGNGSATITRGVGACAGFQLQVNTCFADFALRDNDGPRVEIATCAESDPFDPITLEVMCKNCGAGTADYTYTAGIRIISKAVTTPCALGLQPPNSPKGYFGRELAIFPSAGFTPGAVYIKTVQTITLPENFGYLWQSRDYRSDNGGTGREHDNFASGGYGELNLPLDRSRISGNKVKCKESYCSYIIEHSIPSSDTHTHGNHSYARGRSVILIPSGDATTIADFETKWNAYITSSPGSIKPTVACGSDQDQVEATPEFDTGGQIV